jgi:hypothetical protein
MVKYKCFKTECPECGNSGSLQLFFNREGKVTYARVRHYIGMGKFTYCKVEDLEQLKTLLDGQGGQDQTLNHIDPKHKDSSSKIRVAGPVGFEPTTFSLEG